MKNWHFPLTDSRRFCSRKEYLDRLLSEIKEFASKIRSEKEKGKEGVEVRPTKRSK